MKRFILFLLVGALLVLPLSGCFADNKQDEGTTPNNTTENTTPESTTPEATTPPENDQKDPPMVEGELDKDSELIVTLVNYLKQCSYEYLIITLSLSSKINQIQDGAQPLHVAFDPNSYYYVCGYYNVTHEYREPYHYCCASEYIWIGYENEAEIQEYYNDVPCIVAFQLNRALTVTDILSGEPANDMEHFQIYKPTFENGVNTAPAITIDDTYIYLNNVNERFDEDIIYHSKSWCYHSNATIQCVYLENQYYLSFYEYVIYEDGHRASKMDYTDHFDEYYDALINVVEKEKYSVTTDKGDTIFYGVISIEDFVNGVLK